MVNLPPIPPLLCSTPPPIDFGEDEDVDVFPHSLDSVDDDYDGFLVDDTKTNVHLQSTRLPSACELPSISIYDGLIPPDDEELIENQSSPKSTDAENNKKSINLTEAFNFNVKNSKDNTKKVLRNETELPSVSVKYLSSEIESNKYASSSQTVCLEAKNPSTNSCLSKNVKDLKIEHLNIEAKCKINQTNASCMQNIVSIEDIEDDFSDDELYSPKTQKNFIETDNMTDFFKIEKIKPQNVTGNNSKSDSKDIDSKSLDSIDNNESASLGNENDEFKSFSSNSFIQNKNDMPPPLLDDSNSFDDEEDFGDFADFQDIHFVNDKKHNNNIEINGFNDCTNYKSSEDYTNVNNVEIDVEKETKSIHQANIEKLDEELKNLTSNSSSLSDKFDIKLGELSEQKSLDLQIKTQDIYDKIEITSTANKNCLDYGNELVINEKNLNHKNSSFGNFIAAGDINDNEDFGNFAEFSNSSPDFANINVKTTESTKAPEDISNNDDVYTDFANFESHRDTHSDEKNPLSYGNNLNEREEDNNDDDDFGDFTTAEPVILTASSSTLIKTSQNIISQTPVLPSKNLNERISKIMQLMFTPNTSSAENISDEPKTNKIQDIPFTSIDAAKALEYQWLISSTRHSFIRSLGIDSRNILYGDNWNPTLPRYAANLSFNPLKPMKPAQSSSSINDHSSESKQVMEISVSTKKEALDLDWKSSSTEEQTNEALNDNNFKTPIVVSTGATSLPYISSEPPKTELDSSAIFENALENEEQFSKTPPISEMESVTSFALPIPDVAMNMEFSTIRTEMEEDGKSSLNINEVVVTSTFTGSFKETHIYTPPKTNDFEIKHAIPTPPTSASSPSKASPIDFDYEKAAMGVIIDETVVKKEYRDVEYNPPFSMESLNKSVSSKIDMFETNSYTNANILGSTDIKESDQEEQEANDEFSEFQSVSSPVAISTETVVPTVSKPSEVPKASTVSLGGMILSPAILIPQAISMENQKPTIEWGESTATINPEELARIEELFPEPKSHKSSNSSQKSTPTHQVAPTPSISATVANKELEGNLNIINDDDEDWSDFVSVTVTNNISSNKTGSNNNVLTKNPVGSVYQQRPSNITHRIPTAIQSNSNIDDEWSEFVSSAPTVQQPSAYRVPQFNSGAWQNANFYNNPLSMYHKGPLNMPTAAATSHSTQKYLYNNNNNISQQPYPFANNATPVMLANNQQTPNYAYQQQIHVMQNFSTAPVPTPERLSAAAAAAKHNQFQSIGSAKVAPSIALIPDLGFVAPAIPTHTSFISSLPKPSINMKK